MSAGRKRRVMLAGLCVALLSGGVQAAESDRDPAGLDLAAWARVLEQHTRQVETLAGVEVDYPAVARSGDWKQVLASLRSADRAALATREQKLAFWINVYNILAIDLVAQNWPLESIKDLGSWFSPVWKREAGTVGGRAYTLDEIEHEILRPMGEPRIHAAIVCASQSCPALARTPFRAESLDASLDAAMRRFVRDPRKGARVVPGRETVHLSSIFKWFAEDFEASGGVLASVARHLPEDQARWLREQRGRLSIVYFDYDWGVNG